MPVHCARCGKQLTWKVWGVDEHLCDDERRRLARREKQVAAVVAIMRRRYIGHHDSVAEEIVAKLNQLGVTED